LFKDRAYRVVTGINYKVEWLGVVGQGKDRGRNEGVLHGLKCRISIGGPVEWGVFLGEVKQGSGYVQVPEDKSSVEVAESKERLELFQVSRGQPFHNAVDFSRVHGYPSFGYDEAKIFDLVLCKEALLRLQVKVVFRDDSEDLVCQGT
jgi:hypothetical protein